MRSRGPIWERLGSAHNHQTNTLPYHRLNGKIVKPIKGKEVEIERNITKAGPNRGRAVVYLRTASSDNPEVLEGQRRRCHELAWRLRLRVTGVYTDAGGSGVQADRPALAQLLCDVACGGIDSVIIADAARLARNRQLEDSLFERFRRYGASITTACFD